MRTCQLLTTEIRKWRTGAYINLVSFKGITFTNRFPDIRLLTRFCHFLLCVRIRALYAQILEKDAVIKILNQRLHQDQGRKNEQSPRTNLLNKAAASLRPATSTPSISTTSVITKSRGEGHNIGCLFC